MASKQETASASDGTDIFETETKNEKGPIVPDTVEIAQGDIFDDSNSERLQELGKELNATEADLIQARSFAARTSLDDLFKIIAAIVETHDKDPNFSLEVLQKLKDFHDAKEDICLQPHRHQEWIAKMKLEAALTIDNSPYPEVRACISNTDDPSLPQFTFRVFLVGTIFTVIKAAVNQFFSVRSPSISIDLIVFQILSYPLCKFLARYVPDWGLSLYGTRYSINPGDFNHKEHILIVMMVGSSWAPYTDYIVWVQALPMFFNQPWAKSLAYQLLIAFSNQFIGYSLAGLCRIFLVFPSYCIWPTNFPTLALNQALHNRENDSVLGPFRSVWRITRFKFFLVTSLIMFLYQFFPAYIFPALGDFSWIEWIAPENVWVKAIAGSAYGLGVNPFPNFDWNAINQHLNPLILPLFTTMNVFIGMLVSAVITLGLWVSNAFYTGHLPITSPDTYDRFGNRYNVTMILDDKSLFNLEAYKTYSPVYMSASYVQLYMFYFAQYSGMLTHAVLEHGRELKRGLKGSWASLSIPLLKKRATNVDGDGVLYEDVHCRLMKSYKEVSGWWYMATLVLSVGLGIWGLRGWPTEAPVWVVLFGLFMATLFLLPTGLMFAMTGTLVTMNVLSEFIGGLIVPGNAVAMNFFKTYGTMTALQAISFSADMKMGYYAKIAPIAVFACQIWGTFLNTLVPVLVLRYQIEMDNICNPDPNVAPMRMVCSRPRSFFTASLLWGTLGPRRMWGVGGQYNITLVGFAFGFILCLAAYFLRRQLPNVSWVRKIHTLVFLQGFALWDIFGLVFLWPAVPVALVSWLYVRTRWLGFWSKYNYILHAGFTCGAAIAAVIIFFSFQLKIIKFPEWWGVRVLDLPMSWKYFLYPREELRAGEEDLSFGPGVGDF